MLNTFKYELACFFANLMFYAESQQGLCNSLITSCLAARWPSGSKAFHICTNTHTSYPTDAFVLHLMLFEDTDISAIAH